jgi:hypothetical protein
VAHNEKSAGGGGGFEHCTKRTVVGEIICVYDKLSIVYSCFRRISYFFN